MSNEQWSEWIPWTSIDKPPALRSNKQIQAINDEGETLGDNTWHFTAGDCEWSEITAYRYRLDDNTMTPEEEEIPAQKWDGYVDADDTVPTSIKQLRYQDAKGEDWIDEFARTASVDEFRGAMKFTIGKYNRRAGKKDELIQEIEKMRDYCDRWIEYERAL